MVIKLQTGLSQVNKKIHIIFQLDRESWLNNKQSNR